MCVCVWVGGWVGGWVGVGVCVRACVCVCVRACVRMCDGEEGANKMHLGGNNQDFLK